MAQTQTRAQRGGPVASPARASVSYNLEKEPLRGAANDTASGWRTGLDQWARRRHAAGWLAAVLMVLIVAIGATVIRLLVQAFGNYFGIE